MTGEPLDFAALMAELQTQAQELVTRVEAQRAAALHPTIRRMFDEESANWEAKARAAREAGDTFQRVADAMRAKLGEVAA